MIINVWLLITRVLFNQRVVGLSKWSYLKKNNLKDSDSISRSMIEEYVNHFQCGNGMIGCFVLVTGVINIMKLLFIELNLEKILHFHSSLLKL